MVGVIFESRLLRVIYQIIRFDYVLLMSLNDGFMFMGIGGCPQTPANMILNSTT